MATRQPPDRTADVAAAESVTGCPLVDRQLAVVALHPQLAGFSRLEFVGDAVVNLAVFCAGELAGINRSQLAAAVSNDTFDRIIAASPIAHPRRSGDVLEALVGAVHLGSGFAAAWSASLHIAAAAAGIDPVDPPPVDPPGPDRSAPFAVSQRGLAFVGSAALRAVVADHLVRVRPDATQSALSNARAAALSTASLAAAWRHATGDAVGDQVAADRLQARAAQCLIDEGWDAVVDLVADMVGLPGA